MKYTFPILVSVIVVAALCLAIVETVSAQENINLFKPKNTDTPRPQNPRQIDNRIITGLKTAGDPEKRNAGRSELMYTALFIGGTAVLIVGIVYGLLWQKKRMEWALHDPMALVQELNSVHQLSEQEKWLMLEVSKKNALPYPLQLFVEPKFLLAAWEDDSFVSSQPLVRRLLSKLFNITTESGESSAVLAGMNSETRVYS